MGGRAVGDQLGELRDIEAPRSDAFEQSLPVGGLIDVEPPVEVLSGDIEVPVADAIEQQQPALVDDDDIWR